MRISKIFIALTFVFAFGLGLGFFLRGPDRLDSLLSDQDPKIRQQTMKWLARAPHQAGLETIVANDPFAREMSDQERNEFFNLLRTNATPESLSYLERNKAHKDPYLRLRTLALLTEKGNVKEEELLKELESFRKDLSVAGNIRINVLTELLLSPQKPSPQWMKPFCARVLEEKEVLLTRLCFKRTDVVNFDPSSAEGKKLWKDATTEVLKSILATNYQLCPPYRQEVLRLYIEKMGTDKKLSKFLESFANRLPDEDRKIAGFHELQKNGKPQMPTRPRFCQERKAPQNPLKSFGRK